MPWIVFICCFAGGPLTLSLLFSFWVFFFFFLWVLLSLFGFWENRWKWKKGRKGILGFPFCCLVCKKLKFHLSQLKVRVVKQVGWNPVHFLFYVFDFRASQFWFFFFFFWFFVFIFLSSKRCFWYLLNIIDGSFDVASTFRVPAIWGRQGLKTLLSCSRNSSYRRFPRWLWRKRLPLLEHSVIILTWWASPKLITGNSASASFVLNAPSCSQMLQSQGLS